MYVERVTYFEVTINEDGNDRIDTTPQVVAQLCCVLLEFLLAQKNEEVAALKASVAALQTCNGNLEAMVAERDDEVMTLKTENVTLKATVVEFNSEVTSLKTKVSTLKTQINNQH